MAEILVQNGWRMAVIRPENPELALKLAEHVPIQLSSENKDPAILEAAAKEFNDILSAQPYRFMGFACSDQPAYFLKSDGSIAGRLQAGDSLVDYDSLAKMATLISEGN